MNVSDVKPIVKKYWPWMVGGAVGIFIILKMRGGSKSDGGVGAFYAAQAQGAQAAAGSALQMRQMEMAANQAAAENAFKVKQLDAQREVGLIQAAAGMAGAVGASTSQVLSSLYGPGIAAINATAYENAATMNAAANIVAQGFHTQGQIVGYGAQTVLAAADSVNAWGGVLSGLGSVLHLEVPGEQAISPAGIVGGFR